jgi:hypothetical protein
MSSLIILLIPVSGFLIVGFYFIYGAYKGHKIFLDPKAFRRTKERLGDKGLRNLFIFVGAGFIAIAIWILIWVMIINK